VPKRASSVVWTTTLLALLLAAAAILIGAYTFLPSLVERMVAQSVQDSLGLEKMPGVELESDSPPSSLAGEFSGGEISIEEAQFGGVRAEHVVVNLDPFDVSVLESLTSGAIETGEPLSGTLRAEIPEDEVSRLARAGSDAPVRDVEFHRGRMLVRSSAPLFGVEVPVSVEVDLVLSDESLLFEPKGVEAFGTVVPGSLAEQILAGTEFAYLLGGLPYGAEISGVEVREGRLVLSGEMRRIPLEDQGG